MEYTVYGPYYREDGRQHVILVYLDKTRRTVSYPKFLMEQSLGIELDPEDTVDHIDDDFTNNSLSNLRILDRSTHAKEDVLRLVEQEFTCPQCLKHFVLVGKRLSNAKSNRLKGKAGPFCGRSCAGKYSHEPF